MCSYSRPLASCRSWPALLLALLLLALLASCDGGDADGSGRSAPVVLAASSLQEGLSEAADAYAGQGHPPPVLSFAATSALARQLERGAPADIFIAADDDWMDRLTQAALLQQGSRTDLLTNRLVIIAPRGSEPLPSGDPLAGAGRIAIADPQAVPAGRYAKAALQSLGRWEELQPRLVPAENVRAALVLVERGEVDRGIVYATDAQASAGVEVLFRFPQSGHPPIRYPAALLAASYNPEAARFLAFLRSDGAQAIFRRHGFGTLP